VVFFGDRISPSSVFLIDMSSSMRQATTLRQAEADGAGESGMTRRKGARTGSSSEGESSPRWTSSSASWSKP